MAYRKMLVAGLPFRPLSAGDRKAGSKLFRGPCLIQPSRSGWGDLNLVSSKEILIVSSNKDPASQNIAHSLIAKHGFESHDKGTTYLKGNVRMVILDKPAIFIEPGDAVDDGRPIVFASKHVSTSGRPALTVHATGNLTSKAEFGGTPEEVSFVDPTIVRRVLRTLSREVSAGGLDIDVTMEATHHGPTSFSGPVCFVEVGSGPKEWSDPRLGSMAADAIMSLTTTLPDAGPLAVGFGGTHYSAKHTRICLDGEYQIGHVVPKHALESGVSDQVIQDTLRKTVGNCKTALVDWKGIGGAERRKLVEHLESWGYETVRV